MSSIVILAVGDLDSLPAEVQDITNIFSAENWTVRLCIGDDASRQGLVRVSLEGQWDVVWVGAHSSSKGFILSDGELSPHDLGIWLSSIKATECVLNVCYSLEHVTRIQRVCNSGIACTIDEKGLPDPLAWATGVIVAGHLARTRDLSAAIREVGQNGSQYRYIPARGGREVRAPMNQEDRDLLNQLVMAIKGDGMTGLGLIRQWQQLSQNLENYIEQNEDRYKQQDKFNRDIESRLKLLEGSKPISMTERSVYISAIVISTLAVVLLLTLTAINLRF